MANSVVKKPASMPTEWQDLADAYFQALSESPTPLLKFKKTKFVIHDTEVPLGTKFLAYCGDWQRGWVKFVDGELIEKKIGRVADRFIVLERDELDDLDPINWSRDDDNKPIDPWCRQDYLPLEDVESGERLVFVTSSFGGRIAVEILCGKFARANIDGGGGSPIIKLATGVFHTKKYGEIMRPDFQVVEWAGGGGGGPRDVTPPKATAEIEGPPDYDPADPLNYDDR